MPSLCFAQQASPPDTFRRRGLQALDDGIYSAAARFFATYRSEVAPGEPAFADATALLVEALFRQGKIAEAATILEDHAKRSPGLTDPFYKDSLTYWQAAIAFKQNRLDESLGQITTLLDTHTGADDIRVAALELQGTILSQQRKWEEAERIFQTIIREFSEDPADAGHVFAARLGLAKVMENSSRTEEAIKLLDQLAENASLPVQDRTRARLQVVGVYITRNEINKALEVYKTIAPKQPRIPDAAWHAQLSELLNGLVKDTSYNQALDLIPGLLATAPNDLSRFHTELKQANLLLLAGRLDESAAKLARIGQALTPETEPERTSALATLELQLAEAFTQSAKSVAAEALLRSVIAREAVPKDLRFRGAMNLGAVLSTNGNYEEAIKAFVEGARFAETRERQAQALFNAGKAAFRKAELNSENAATQRIDFRRAANFYQNVADKFPEMDLGATARYRLGLAKARAGHHKDAADIFAQFLKTYADHPKWSEAALQRIRALKQTGDFQATTQAVTDFYRQKPEAPQAPDVLMEGFDAARQAKDYAQANGFLSAIIDNAETYAASGLPPHALYERIHLNFLYGKTAPALADCNLFLKTYAKLPLAADVRLWLADHYCARAKQAAEQPGKETEAKTLYATAYDKYLDVVSNHSQTIPAHRALYAAARIQNYRGNAADARQLITRLLTQQLSSEENRLQAFAHVLLAELDAEEGLYENALALFRKATTFTEDPDIVLSARGREADMLVASAGLLDSASPEYDSLLARALELLEEITVQSPPGSDILAGALFKAGRIMEMREDPEAAVEKYLLVIYAYEEAVQEGRTQSWHFYARAVFAAGKILENQEKYEQAMRYYKRLAGSGLPLAEEARARVKTLQEVRGLN